MDNIPQEVTQEDKKIIEQKIPENDKRNLVAFDLNVLLQDWKGYIIDSYKRGYGDEELIKNIISLKGIGKFNKDIFEFWYTTVLEFREVIDAGRSYCKAWWIEQARKNVGDRNFNTLLWSKNMMNRYGWADRMDKTSTDKITQTSLDLTLLTDAELDTLIKLIDKATRK